MIDRRIFLQLTGGAAVASSAAMNAIAQAQPTPATHAVPSPVQVGNGVVSPLADPLRILSERLALATDGRLSLAAMPGASASVVGREHLVLATEDMFADEEPTSLLLGGIPRHDCPDNIDFTAWLRVMGGQALWDMAAAREGWKPLMVGTAGCELSHVWSRVRLGSRDDLLGLRIAVPRSVHEQLRRMIAMPRVVEDSKLLPALLAGEIDAFETDDPAVSFAAAQQLGENGHWYVGGIGGTERVLSLRLPLALWERLPQTHRTIVEAVAEETAATLRAMRRVHADAVTRTIAQQFGRRPRAVSGGIRGWLGLHSEAILSARASTDPLLAAALASMQALRAPANRPDDPGSGAPVV